jgi:hypothetical protein
MCLNASTRVSNNLVVQPIMLRTHIGFCAALAIILSLCFVRTSAGIQTVGKFQTISIPLPHAQLGVKNVWDDITIDAQFTSPSGHKFNRQVGDTIGGFYHSKDLWMVRFAPDEAGTWTYSISLTDRGISTSYIDGFLCVASTEQGFLRIADDNKRWYYSGSGKFFSGVGFGDCMGSNRDSILQFGGLDGGYRPPHYHTGIEWNMPYSQYLIAYGDVAHFNLYRYSDGNCAYSMVKSITASGNNYDTLYSRWTDTLFAALRQHGFRIYMTILASNVGSSSNDREIQATARYAQYCIDRFGALVDVWELTNESSPDSLWVSRVARYIQTHDIYSHPVSVSWEQPTHPAIEVISPHWYGREDVKSSDQVTADQINKFAAIKKPVIFGEQGEGGVWDSLSPIRLRGRIWSALFNEGTLIFWNSSFAKDCACNQYLGWPERRDVRIMQNFAPLLDPYVVARTRATIGECTAWGMNGQNLSNALYLRNDHDVFKINSGLQVPVNVPTDGRLIWYDVHTGDIVVDQAISKGQTTLTAPDFQTDIAMIVGNFTDPLLADSLFRLDVNPRTIQSLSIPKGEWKQALIKLSNTGKAPIVITKGFVASPSVRLEFSFTEPLPITLAPADSRTVTINYRMLDTGGAAATFSFAHNASPASENIAFDVTGIPAQSVSASPMTPTRLVVEPNPASNRVSLKYQTANPERISYTIYSLTGQTEAFGEFLGETAINCEVWPNGRYQVVLDDHGSVISSTDFIVVH